MSTDLTTTIRAKLLGHDGPPAKRRAPQTCRQLRALTDDNMPFVVAVQEQRLAQIPDPAVHGPNATAAELTRLFRGRAIGMVRQLGASWTRFHKLAVLAILQDARENGAQSTLCQTLLALLTTAYLAFSL